MWVYLEISLIPYYGTAQEASGMLKLDEQLRRHILESYPLSESDLDMLLDELGEYWNRSYQEFVRSRHLELQRLKMRNEEIYRTIRDELRMRRFAPPDLSTRQIRRIIYG
jgi:hypothetical protein